MNIIYTPFMKLHLSSFYLVMYLNKFPVVPAVKNRKYRIWDLFVTRGHEIEHNDNKWKIYLNVACKHQCQGGFIQNIPNCAIVLSLLAKTIVIFLHKYTHSFFVVYLAYKQTCTVLSNIFLQLAAM